MKTVRITGIVKLANRVRRELAAPVSPDRLAQLRQGVDAALRTIDRILADARTGIRAMPPPSRKAYQFLAGIDFESIPTRQSAPPDALPPGSVSFPGLRSFLNEILDDLAGCADQSIQRQVHDSIRQWSQNVEDHIRADQLKPDQLKPESRAIRGWLAYFSGPAHFERYMTAVRLVRDAFNEAAGRSRRIRPPVLVHFRPMKGIYRIRIYADFSRVHLPTGMVCFDEQTFRSLAALPVGKGRNRQVVLDAMVGGPYQTVLTEIDLLSGLIDHTAGVYHDLAASFDRVNDAYFQGSLPGPHLTWSSTFTARKFGHYDRTRDTVMVSSTLDRDIVPQYAVDFIVYHELLHKKLGIRWNKGRMAAHTPEFRRAIGRFQYYGRAKAILASLARQDASPTPKRSGRPKTRRRKATKR